MLELWQTEWCPASRRVRERLTELGVDYVTAMDSGNGNLLPSAGSVHLHLFPGKRIPLLPVKAL